MSELSVLGLLSMSSRSLEVFHLTVWQQLPCRALCYFSTSELSEYTASFSITQTSNTVVFAPLRTELFCLRTLSSNVHYSVFGVALVELEPFGRFHQQPRKLISQSFDNMQ